MAECRVTTRHRLHGGVHTLFHWCQVQACTALTIAQGLNTLLHRGDCNWQQHMAAVTSLFTF